MDNKKEIERLVRTEGNPVQTRHSAMCQLVASVEKWTTENKF
jgi:hypothetical protein